THHNHKLAHPHGIKTLGVGRTGITANNRPTHHNQRLRPINSPSNHENDHRRTIDDGCHHCLEAIHPMNIIHTQQRVSCQHHHPNATTEKSTVKRDNKL